MSYTVIFEAGSVDRIIDISQINMPERTGNFVISLDFELMWGVRDLETPESYGHNLLGVHQLIPQLLSRFREYGVKATFAVVGLLFFETKKELLHNLPRRRPQYKNSYLSPYGVYLEKEVGQDYLTDLLHFAPQLIQLIKNTPDQEIGTHSFAHYYCLEPEQNIDDFKDDLRAAINIAAKSNINITSIVFPRNQFSASYLRACAECGILTYRGNELSWLYTARAGDKETLTRRALRLLDSYINITGYHCYSEEYMASSYLINIPSSRFLRPVSTKNNSIDWLRLRRIKMAMTHAAKHKLTYHLWWHPHNMGIEQSRNLLFLDDILLHFKRLHEQYSWNSITMTGLAKQLIEKYGAKNHSIIG